MNANEEKIKVFISSRLNDGSDVLKVIRKAIKDLLEQTDLFSVFLFEDSGSSSLNVEDYYLSKLEDADYCVFLLDSVPINDCPGLLKELNYSRQKNIQRMYFFTTNDEQDVNHVYIRLVDKIKYTNVDHPEDCILKVLQSLVQDVIFHVKGERKERESFLPDKGYVHDYPEGEFYSFKFLRSDNNLSTLLRKILFHPFSIDNVEYQGKNLTTIQDGYEVFLLALFHFVEITDNQREQMLEMLVAEHPQTERDIFRQKISVLLDLVFSSSKPDREVEIQKLEKVKELASGIPWLLGDVLIDLRFLAMKRDKNFFGTPYQEQIEALSFGIQYPQLDRFAIHFYEELAKQEYSAFATDAYITQTMFYWDNDYGNDILKFFLTTLYNGSSVQMKHLYDLPFLYLWKEIQSSPQCSTDIIYSCLRCALLVNSTESDKILSILSSRMSCLEEEQYLFLLASFKIGCSQDASSLCRYTKALSAIGNYLSNDHFLAELNFVHEQLKHYSATHLSEIVEQEIQTFERCGSRCTHDQIETILQDVSSVFQYPRIYTKAKELFQFVHRYHYHFKDSSWLKTMVQTLRRVDFNKSLELCLCYVKYSNKKLGEKLMQEYCTLDQKNYIESLYRRFAPFEQGYFECFVAQILQRITNNLGSSKNIMIDLSDFEQYVKFHHSSISKKNIEDKLIPIFKTVLLAPTLDYSWKTSVLRMMNAVCKREESFKLLSNNAILSGENLRMDGMMIPQAEYECLLAIMKDNEEKKGSINFVTVISNYPYEDYHSVFARVINEYVGGRISRKQTISKSLWSSFIQFFGSVLFSSKIMMIERASYFFALCIRGNVQMEFAAQMLLQLSVYTSPTIHYNATSSLVKIRKRNANLADEIYGLCKVDKDYKVRLQISQYEKKLGIKDEKTMAIEDKQ